MTTNVDVSGKSGIGESIFTLRKESEMYRISQVLQNLHRESILDLEEECRQNRNWKAIRILETEIDSPLYEPDICDGFIDELIQEIME